MRNQFCASILVIPETRITGSLAPKVIILRITSTSSALALKGVLCFFGGFFGVSLGFLWRFLAVLRVPRGSSLGFFFKVFFGGVLH